MTDICPARCRQVHAQDRDGRSLYQLTGVDMRSVSWRLRPGQSYAIRASPDCSQAAGAVSKASVVPWIDPNDPVNSSTIDVFIDPAFAHQMRAEQQGAFWVCVEAERPGCLCKLDPPSFEAGYRLATHLSQMLPASAASFLIQWQLSMELQCPSPWIPDYLVLLVFAWALLLLVLACEGLWRACTDAATVPPEGTGSLSVVVRSPWQDCGECSKVLSFILLGQTLQASTLGVLVQTAASEQLVWFITGLSLCINILAVWRFHHIVCRAMLVNSLLEKNIILAVETSKLAEAFMVGVVILYALLVVFGNLGEMKNMLVVAKLVIYVVGNLAGPVWALIHAIRSREESNRLIAEVRMQGKAFASFKKTSEASSLPWPTLVEICRAGNDPVGLAAPFKAGLPEEVRDGRNFNFFRDVGWHRRLVFACTGSRAAYMLLPSFGLAMALLMSCGAFGAAGYLCSRGQLASLQPATLEDTLDFAPWKDRYAFVLDSSFHEVTMIATTAPTTKELHFELPRSQPNHSSPMTANVDLLGVPVPRVATFIATGLRASEPPRRYGVGFTPFRVLPVRVMISDQAGGFQRCLSWGTLAGSRVSVPQHSGNLTVTVFLTDFAVGVPTSRAPVGDHLWTEYAKSSRACSDTCEVDADCLSSFSGVGGCYFAKHHHGFHEKSCSGIASEAKATHSRGDVLSHMHGCAGYRRQCGPGVPVRDLMVKFDFVRPDWQANSEGALEFSLALVAEGMQQTASDVQELSLRRGAPLPFDVLVHLEASVLSTTKLTIPVHAIVDNSGNISMTVGRYNPLELQTGRTMRLTVAPVLPDRDFKVSWLLEVATPADNPSFQRCSENSLLNARLAACNATAQWPVQSLTLPLSRFMPDGEHNNIEFTILPSRPREETMFPDMPSFRVSLSFDGVDSPAAWVAEQGCSVVHDWEETGVFKAVVRSPDAFCKLLDYGCHDRSKFGQLYKEFDRIFEQALATKHYLNPAQQVQGFACAYQNGAMSDNDRLFFYAVQHWRYVPGLGITGKEFDKDGKTIYVRRSDTNGYLYEVPTIPLATFLSSISVMPLSRSSSALEFLSWVCNSTTDMFDSLDQVIDWMQHAVQTGSVNVTTSVFYCLKRFSSTSLSGRQAEVLAKELWEQTSRQIQEGHTRLPLAKVICSWSEEVLKRVVTLLVRDKRILWFQTFAEAVGGPVLFQNWSSWRLELQDSQALVDLPTVLKLTQHLRELSVSAGEAPALPQFTMQPGGFFQTLSNLKNLNTLEFSLKMDAETTTSFVQAIRHLPLKKLVARHMSFGHAGLVQQMHLQSICLSPGSDAKAFAQALGGTVEWTAMVMGNGDPAGAADLLARAKHLRKFGLILWAQPTVAEWTSFWNAVRELRDLEVLAFRNGDDSFECFPGSEEILREVAPHLPPKLHTIGMSECHDGPSLLCPIIQQGFNKSVECNNDMVWCGSI